MGCVMLKKLCMCGKLIDAGKYPYCKDYKMAMQRLLTEEEFKRLRKKDRYFNSQKGVRAHGQNAKTGPNRNASNGV